VKLITLYVPEPYLKALDELVSKRLYPHRAEAIRAAIRDLIMNEGSQPRAEVSEESADNITVAMRHDEQKEMESCE
jgi:Arc/MetJ-type ribon-helix-helix transcriptional regulator